MGRFTEIDQVILIVGAIMLYGLAHWHNHALRRLLAPKARPVPVRRRRTCHLVADRWQRYGRPRYHGSSAVHKRLLHT